MPNYTQSKIARSIQQYSQAMTSPFEESIQEAIELISLPGVYLKLKRLIDDEDSVIDDFATAIHLDPKLSVTVLKLANSAFYGFSGQIDNLNRAVNMIGIGQVYNLALGISAVASMDFPNKFVSLKKFWRTSLFTGILARNLGQRLELPKSERLFVIGLLHEIGHLLMYAKFPEETKKVRYFMKKDNLKDYRAEQKIFGSHYGDVGAKLLKQWELSETFQNIVKFQPSPHLAKKDRKEAALLNLSKAYARYLFMSRDKPLKDLLNPYVWKLTGLKPEIVGESLEESKKICAEMEVFILK